MAKVSIIVPIYNVEEYLCQCLDSIVNQTLYDLEIICIDDGSTDRSGEILDEYAKNDLRIRAFHQKNKGLGATRNRAIDLVTGKYILFVDSDDYLDPKAAELISKRMSETNADLLLFNARDFDAETGKPLFHNYLRMKSLERYDSFTIGDMKEYAFQITANNCWARAYKRDIFQDLRLRFFEDIRYEDYYFCFLSLLIAKKITYIDRRLYFYRTKRFNSLMATDVTHCLDPIISFKRTQQNILADRLLTTPELQSSFDRKVNGVLLYLFSFHNSYTAYEKYYNHLKKALPEMGLIKEDEGYYFSLSERDQQKRLMETADAKEFLYQEYKRYHKESSLMHQKAEIEQQEKNRLKKKNETLTKQISDHEAIIAKLKSENKALKTSKDEWKNKYDALNRKFIIRVERKIKKILKKLLKKNAEK